MYKIKIYHNNINSSFYSIFNYLLFLFNYIAKYFKKIYKRIPKPIHINYRGKNFSP